MRVFFNSALGSSHHEAPLNSDIVALERFPPGLDDPIGPLLLKDMSFKIQQPTTYYYQKLSAPHLGMSLSVATGVAGLSSRVGLSLSVVHLAQTLVAGEDLLIAHNVDPEVSHAREELHLVPGVDTAGSL